MPRKVYPHRGLVRMTNKKRTRRKLGGYFGSHSVRNAPAYRKALPKKKRKR